MDWQLDTHSTFLSRKHSFHRVEGHKRYTKVRKNKHVNKPNKSNKNINFIGFFSIGFMFYLLTIISFCY